MRTLLQAALSVAVLAASAHPYAWGKASTAPAVPCENSHKVFTPKNPRMARDGTIVPGQTITQAALPLSGVSTVQIVEHPKSGKDVDQYDTSVTVLGGQQPKAYPLKDLIKGGEVLRLVEVATVCESPDEISLFLAFEAGASGAMEGFVVVQYSPQGVDVQALPSAKQGKIIVEAGAPDKVTLWSAGEDIGISCDACLKRYYVKVCQLSHPRVTCSKRPGTIGPYSPGKFILERIEVR